MGAPGLFQRLGRGFQRCQLLRLPGLQDCHLLLQLAPLLLLLPVGASERQDQGAAGRVWTAEPGNSAPPQGTAPPPHPGQRRGRSGAPRGRGYVLAGSGHPSGKAWPALHLLPIFQVGEMRPRDTPAVSRGRLRGGGRPTCAPCIDRCSARCSEPAGHAPSEPTAPAPATEPAVEREDPRPWRGSGDSGAPAVARPGPSPRSPRPCAQAHAATPHTRPHPRLFLRRIHPGTHLASDAASSWANLSGSHALTTWPPSVALGTAGGPCRRQKGGR